MLYLIVLFAEVNIRIEHSSSSPHYVVNVHLKAWFLSHDIFVIQAINIKDNCFRLLKKLGLLRRN